ncbi:MAG: sulfotransferase [Vulcanimicrobiota bacterium]
MTTLNTCLPNFIVPGAARSGTTSLFYYLSQHPQIHIPKKECRFFSRMTRDYTGPGDEAFNRTITRDLDQYRALYGSKPMKTAVGDISPDYLYYYEQSIPYIKEVLGDTRIMIILRNPVERAFSQYLYFTSMGRETLSFEEALCNEGGRKEKNYEWAWYYQDVSFYYKQVKAYMDSFCNIRIYLLEDLEKDPLTVLKDMFSFLEVDNTFVPEVNVKYNTAGRITCNRALFYKMFCCMSMCVPFFRYIWPLENYNTFYPQFLEKCKDRSSLPVISTESREHLKRLYHQEIIMLQELIKRDLSSWL